MRKTIILLSFIMPFHFGGYETMVNSSVKNNSGHLRIFREAFVSSMRLCGCTTVE
jgi:hypothetical protein